MECSELLEQIDAWLDGECESAQAAELEAHLAHCAACRGNVEQRRDLDQQLAVALGPSRAAAVALANGVIRQLGETKSVSAGRGATAPASWIQLLWAAAAGVLLAVWILGPQRTHTPPALQNPVAMVKLTAATGPVQAYDATQQRWRNFQPHNPVPLSANSVFRTTAAVQCEIETQAGCVVRLNENTEVALLSDRTVELRQGQMWCRAPQESAIEVRIAQSDSELNAKNANPLARCDVAPASHLGCTRLPGEVEFVNASGAVNVYTATASEELAAGESAHFLLGTGKLQQAEQPVDPLRSTSWIHPLLARNSGDDDELRARVHQLLDRATAENHSPFYEQEIRALGEHAAVPLLQIVETPMPTSTPARTMLAMRLAADLAPGWLIPHFIDLLESGDGEIRVLAATALQRLTGLTMNVDADQWRSTSEATDGAIQRWRQWWSENQHRHPAPKS